MNGAAGQARLLRFGTFELDLAAGELRKNGAKVRLQEQPFQLLAALAGRPGEVVTREELKEKLWPADTYVDFDRSLNTAASKLRDALGDSASSPRFIETLPRRGYRFLASLEFVGDAETGGLALSTGVRAQPAVSLRADRKAAEQSDPRRKLRVQQALLAVTVVALLSLAFVHFRQPVPEAPLRKFTFTPPLPLVVRSYNTDVAISPNGRYIAFNSMSDRKQLSIQALDRQQPWVLEGTEDAHALFWSPGSDFIGFFSRHELKKVSIHGGPAIRICEVIGGSPGASWSPDGDWIVFSAGNPRVLYEVPASGGTPNLLVSPEGSDESPGGPTGGIWRPHFLPSEAAPRVLLFAFGTRTAPTMMVQDLETGRREILGPGALPFYSPSGHIVYQAAGLTYDLWALPFSLDTLQATGRPFPISEHSRDPTVAGDGTLVYVDAPASGTRKLVWLNRAGEKTGEIGQAQPDINFPTLSLDGRLLAVVAGQSTNVRSLWVHDIAGGIRTRLRSGPEMSNIYLPVWSPSAQQVAFSSNRAGHLDVFLTPADGSGEAKALVATSRMEFPVDWSQDGKYLLYTASDPESWGDVWYLERNEEGSEWEPHPFLQAHFNEGGAQFSPDGRYVAYRSDESGQAEVYVRPFPTGRGKWTVSSKGGRQPRWRGDGKELFYLERGAMVAVSVSTDPSFSLGSRTTLFERSSLRKKTSQDNNYDVSADGKRFVLAEPVGEDPAPSIHVVQNWFAEFKDRQGE